MTETVAAPKAKKKVPVKKLIKWLVIAAVLTAALVLGLRWLDAKKAAAGQSSTEYQTAPVERRTITSSLSGSGTLQPAASFTVTTMVEGEIISDTFEEGDLVTEGAVLYQVDSSDTANSIQRSQISLNQAQRNYQKALNAQSLESDVAGQVVSLEVEVGDKIGNNQVVARLRDATVMTLKLPFPADDARGFYQGQLASVTLDGSLETLTGTVSAVSATDEVGVGNSILRTVTIEVKNPGGLATSQAATAVIGGVGCAGSGTFAYRSESTINASSAGTVTALHIKEGDWVSKGQKVLSLGGDSVTDQVQSASDSLKNAQLSMENTRDQLENYTITAPVTGTVVDKNKKAGDTVQGNDKTLCTIYDLSYLEMTINIDELDVNKIAVGQSVTVTADAAEGRVYQGTVTKVSVVGSTSMGATTYPATIRIDDTDGLLPGMNADAEIVLSRAENVLAIPVSAVSRGNRVLITEDSPTAKAILAAQGGQETGGGKAEGGFITKAGAEEAPDMEEAEREAPAAGEAPAEAPAQDSAQRPGSGKGERPGFSGERPSFSGERPDFGGERPSFDGERPQAPGGDKKPDAGKAEDAEKPVSPPESPAPSEDAAGTSAPVPSASPAPSAPASPAPDNATPQLPGQNASGLQAPEGYVYVTVVTGASDESYVEIVSGLQEGDVVAYVPSASGSNRMYNLGAMSGMGGMGMPGMGGGMPGGGMPGMSSGSRFSGSGSRSGGFSGGNR